MFSVYSKLLFCLVCVCVCLVGCQLWLSHVCCQWLLSVVVVVVPVSQGTWHRSLPVCVLASGHLVVVIVSSSCRWTTVLDLVVVYHTHTHVYSEVQGHLLLFHSSVHCYCRKFEIASETWSKPCKSAPCQVLFPLQRWFGGTYRLQSRQPSSF